MSGKWKIRKHKHDSAKGSTPMVSLEPTPLLIEEIHFATLKDYVEIRERGKALRPLEGPPK